MEIKTHPKQSEALSILKRDKINTLFYGGARGGGKSHLARLYAVLRAQRYPNSRTLIVRASFPDLNRSVVDNIKKEYSGWYTEYKEKNHTFYFANGSTIECTYIAHETDLETVQGVEYSTIILEEASQHYKKTFDILRLSLRDSTGIPCKMLCTFNWNNKGFSWLKRLCWDKIYDEIDPERVYFLRATVNDNPTLFDDGAYMKIMEELSPSERKKQLDGDPSDGGEGLFFTEFKQSIHREAPFSILPHNAKGRLFGALDIGTSHSTAFQLGYIDDDRVLHIIFTYCQNGYTIEHHARAIYDEIASNRYSCGLFPEIIWCDPAGFTEVRLNERSIRSPADEFIDLFKSHNAITKFERANNSRANGCHIMRSMLSKNKIRYFAGYNQSYEEGMQSAITDKNNIESYQKVSTDGDDVLDVNRYLAVGVSSLVNIAMQTDKPKTHLEKLLKGKLPHQKQNNGDFFAVGTKIGGI